MQVSRFQQEAAGLARARAEKESELRKLRQENGKYVEDLEEREKKFQVCFTAFTTPNLHLKIIDFIWKFNKMLTIF